MEEITLRGNPYEIRPISAYDAVRGAALAQKSAEALKKIWPEDLSRLCDGGCIAALCLYRQGRRAFHSPLSALRSLSVEEICLVEKAYLSLMAEGKEGEHGLL